MHPILYLDGASGISGDMTVGALLDLGASAGKLHAVLESLNLEGVAWSVSRKHSRGISGCDFSVHLPGEDGSSSASPGPHEHFSQLHSHDPHGGHHPAHPPHAHSHEPSPHDEHSHHSREKEAYDSPSHHPVSAEDHHALPGGKEAVCCKRADGLYGESAGRSSASSSHPGERGAVPAAGGHVHRNLSDVYAVIDRGQMSDRARALAKKIFRIVAEAESKAHGCPLEEVHFHEVGALDSIVDIVAASVLVDDLGITDCVVTGFSEGSGFVRCQHGDLPVPVPAVLNIAEACGIALRPCPAVHGEMVTPTGIAIAAALRTRSELPAEFRIRKCGTGLGKRDFGRPNFLRAMWIEEDESTRKNEQVCLLECNLDDSSGETFGFVMEKLMDAGALDVHFVPCFMKKNRPAYLLRVIVDEARLADMERIIFESTTTIGLRRIPIERTRMDREIVELTLPFGKLKAKRCSWNGIVCCYPEYESVKRLSESSGVDFATVLEEAKRAAAESLP